MSIGLITHDHPNLKTEQVMQGLRMAGETPTEILILPYVAPASRTPRFQHRPDPSAGAAHPAMLARALGVPARKVPSLDDVEFQADHYLATIAVEGAGAPSEPARIIACHAGIAAKVLGADAFKWTIHEDQRLGVTLHRGGDPSDPVAHLATRRTPVLETDTVHGLSRRHYAAEILILCAARRYLDAPEPAPEGDPGAPKPDMRPETEEMMLSRFPRWRAKRAGPIDRPAR